MVPLTSLWLPILVSAALVFVASSIIHMVLTYHRTDFRGVPAEDKVMDALRGFAIPPGDYVMPFPPSPEARKTPEFQAKFKAGPVVFMTIPPKEGLGMGGSLAQWFGFCLLVSIFAGYVAGRALGADSEYLAVFRLAGTTAFAGYALGSIPLSIWYKRSWTTTVKGAFDGLIYALLTAGTFGWLWP
jgi:hypothetical protein